MKFFLAVLKTTAALSLVAITLGLIGAVAVYAWVGHDLPEVAALREVKLQVPLRVLDRDDGLIEVYGEKRRDFVTIDQIPERLQQAFIAGEDARFYEHPGVDYQGIARAILYIARTGEKGPGGSTITQQLARNFFLSFEQTYIRKLKEILLALKIERELCKPQILELYLNKIYLGNRAYGVAAAAEVYYGKPLANLTLAESAMIAALPKAPSRINPIASPERSKQRRDYVINRMRELAMINDATADAAIATEDRAYLHGPQVITRAPYAAEAVRSLLLGLLGDTVYEAGFNVRTTIDGRLQAAADRSLREGLRAYDRRHGFRGPLAQFEPQIAASPDALEQAMESHRSIGGLTPAIVVEVSDELAIVQLRDGQLAELTFDSMRWAREYLDPDAMGPRPTTANEVLRSGDVVYVARDSEANWVLAQAPAVEGALIAMNPKDGAIRAMSGGFDFARSKFNRATQARRQPGSGFKPFIYSAALDSGLTTASVINDAPVVFEDPGLERRWRPENYSGKFYGPTRLREGMVNSRNLISIRVLNQIGIDVGRQHARRFGFEPDAVPRNLSMALGSGAAAPLQIARGFAAFANGGFLVEPYLIEQITDAEGNVLFAAAPLQACSACVGINPVVRNVERNPDLLPATYQANAEPPIFDLTDDADDLPLSQRAPRIVSAGNAYLISSMLSDVVDRGTAVRAKSLDRDDLAGKTGTTNDQRDAWFTGFNDDLVASVWVGFDDLKQLGRGEVGGAAALPIWIDFMRTALAESPTADFAPPDDVVVARIDPDSGLLVRAGEPGMLEYFLAGDIPALKAGPEANPFDTIERPDDEEDDVSDIF